MMVVMKLLSYATVAVKENNKPLKKGMLRSDVGVGDFQM